MALIRTFGDSESDRVMKQNIWDRFLSYYSFINECVFFIRYPNFWYQLQGIVSPRQIIAWTQLIKIIGEDIFNKIPLALNHNLDDDNIFFLKEYKKHFHNMTNLNITFTCGYFWHFVKKESKRREVMKKFVKDKIDEGCNIAIFTQDKTLKKEINCTIGRGKKPTVRRRIYRMDIHSTIVEPKDKRERDRTLLFMELPHTERTSHRLEAYVTIGQLKEFGCDESQINKLLRFLKRQRYSYLFTKSIPSKFDLAFNWGAL